MDGEASRSGQDWAALVVEDSKTDNLDHTNGSLQTRQSSLWTRKQQAICVRHAFKTYGSMKKNAPVLNNLNMTVAKGTTYGLLGSSGCGKTTLLSCIVGRRRLNSGEIWVLGGKPGTKGKRVGYMPQEMALYGEFSIKETIMYFGWIFGMETMEIEVRLQFLLDLLDLPSQNRLVKNLSGGQQRRVSFAAALMHDPELLILDEPTVGVDPLLRQSIWNYLMEITRDGNKTVILTTHYIEEARQAHAIGLMRGGRLLAEESPQTLLTMYGCQSLEEVFLKLSRKQAGQNDLQANLNISNTSLNLCKKDEPTYDIKVAGDVGLDSHQSKEFLILDDSNGGYDDCTSFFRNLTTVGKMKALLQKNFLKMWRNVGVMLFIFALPVMQVILFCLAVGKDPTDLKIAVVNEEIPNWSKGGVCNDMYNCTTNILSCRYLQHLGNKTLVQEPYATVGEALNAVRLGNAWGAMHFVQNFSMAMVPRIIDGRDSGDLDLHDSQIRVWLDMSNHQIGLMLNRDLLFSYREFAQDLYSACQLNPKLADLPIQFMDPMYGKRDLTLTDFVAPGVILTIVFFLAVALTTSALITERAEGLLDRSWVAGVSAGEVLSSHVITQFVVMCGQTALVLIFMMLVFGVECQGNIFYVIVLTILQGLCGMCFGFAISAICELELTAIQLALGSFYPTLLLSGIIWPIEGMPLVLRYVALFLPLTMATTSLRSILTRGWTITEPNVYNGFISTLIWIALYLVITMVILKAKKG